MAEQPSAAPPETSAEQPQPQARGSEPVVISAPPASEEQPPTFANLIAVESTLDAVSINLFYMPPGKISRILASADPVKEGFGERVGGAVRVTSEPVSRLALPMSTASDLLVELYRALMFSAPGLRDELLARARERTAEIDRRIGSAAPTPEESAPPVKKEAGAE